MVTVFGLGFVGLTTALGFAHLGYPVYGIDVDEKRKKLLERGELPFQEPHMDVILKEQLEQNFIITDDVDAAVAASQYLFFCVGTPYGQKGKADLTHLFQAIDRAAEAALDSKFRVLVIKSTVPPSTTEEEIVPYIEARGGISSGFGIAVNPEFLREGYCWDDFIHADRIVLGCRDERSAEMLKRLYKPMEIPIFCVTPSTAEFVKYLSNTLLATLISFSNEMAEMADRIGGIDVPDAFRILHMDKRWGGCNMTGYVYPGCGYGGYCLPKDTCALCSQSVAKGYEPRILKQVIEVNERRFTEMAQKIAGELGKDRTIGILGLSFKPRSDDVRNTPAAKILSILLEKGYTNFCAYDPAAMTGFRSEYPALPVAMASSAEEVCEKSDVIAIVTAWEEFRECVQGTTKRIVDCRYML